MKTLVVALGGNALLQRGEALTAENQYRNIASAVPALARLARSYRLAIVHGNGPQVGLLALQNLAWKEVEPYPLDVLVAESQGMIGYMLAQSLSAQPQMPPVTTVLTRIEVCLMIRRFCSQRNLLVRFISQKNKRHWKRLTAGR